MNSDHLCCPTKEFNQPRVTERESRIHVTLRRCCQADELPDESGNLCCATPEKKKRLFFLFAFFLKDTRMGRKPFAALLSAPPPFLLPPPPSRIALPTTMVSGRMSLGTKSASSSYVAIFFFFHVLLGILNLSSERGAHFTN
ncbi:hypothetical protein BgiBS90_003661 [Biomphalaria glabrata]|nr:hypothetical protein BgiBS90_003661 [Biomphalaria glabrata]